MHLSYYKQAWVIFLSNVWCVLRIVLVHHTRERSEGISELFL